MKVPENIRDAFAKALKYRRAVVGTASKGGVPNAVPIGVGRFVDEETLCLVDNYFLKTRKNLENPYAAVTFWVSEEKEGKLVTNEGYQLKGKVEIQTSGDLYEKIKAETKAIRADFPVKAIALLRVDEIYDVKAGPTAGKRIL